jgi:hypothetical protein
MELLFDADFGGNANPESAHMDRSSIGYIVMRARCPLTWASKLQTEKALSTTEAEFIALSVGIYNNYHREPAEYGR